MLVRTTNDGGAECIVQEHHAFLSGVMAGAWLPTTLEPELVQTIGLHDNPWRPVDREPRYDPETGWPVDFVAYPVEAKVDFYRRGIDELEAIHPWVAYLVSLHYTTFAGTRDVDELCTPEETRRERLEAHLADRYVAASGRALDWLKYFDVFSLYVCLAGPDSDEAAVPGWLAPPSGWAEAPDGTPLKMEWRDDETLALDPWPFAVEKWTFDVEHRRLEEPAQSERAFRNRWEEALHEVRSVTFLARQASDG